MTCNEPFSKNKSEKCLYNNFSKKKIEGNEEEYECGYSPNKDKNNLIFSSLSFKSDLNEQNNNKKDSENIDDTDINKKKRIYSKKDLFNICR